MLAPVLLLWLVLEAGCYLLIGRGLFAAPCPLVVATTLGGMLGFRAALNMMTWIISMLFASPAPRLGTLGTLRLMLAEFAAFLLSFLLVIPFERLWMPADRLPAGRHQTPILLIHGFGCSRGVWWLLRRRLEAAGHLVATVSLFPPMAALGKLVPQLQERIEAVCQATGSQQVILIGHSMGGLIARSYLARHGIARVSRLITLSTPHQGSELARLGYGRAARDMRPGSLWLTDMAEEKIGVPAISLRNPYDNYVMPQDNQRHPQMQDIPLPAQGHLSELYDRRVAQILIDLLKATP